MMTSITRWVLGHKRLVTLAWVVVTLVGIATVGLFLTVGPTVLFARLMRWCLSADTRLAFLGKDRG